MTYTWQNPDFWNGNWLFLSPPIYPSPNPTIKQKQAPKEALFRILWFCHLPALLKGHLEPNWWESRKIFRQNSQKSYFKLLERKLHMNSVEWEELINREQFWEWRVRVRAGNKRRWTVASLPRRHASGSVCEITHFLLTSPIMCFPSLLTAQ